MIRMLLGLFVVGLGSFELGFGIKFSWVWWATPNLIDGIISSLAGVLLIGIGTVYCFKLLPLGGVKEEHNGH